MRKLIQFSKRKDYLMKKTKLFFGAASALLLAACGTQQAQNNEVKSNFPEKVSHEGTAISGGTLKYAIVADSPLSGVLSSAYYMLATDAEVIAFMDEGLFRADADKNITKDGIGQLTHDADAKTITVTIKEGLKWSDGQPLTIDDYIYAFEVIGHKDYTGQRYDETFEKIEGMTEYHEGKTDKISGITKNSDYSVTFKMKELTPSMLKSGGLWGTAVPKHTLKDIPVKDQAASDAVRKNPVGLGAFRVKNVVSGESVELEANPHYWLGKPKIDGVVIDVVNDTNSPEEFKKGNYDIMSVPTVSSIFDSFKAVNNGTLIGSLESTYNYLGFKLGKWNADTNTNETDPNAKMANKSLRQAMGYALDMDEFANSFYGQLRVRANTLFAPTFKSLIDNSLPGYKYDAEKAKKLLDDAGYKDTNGDGLRENPKGEKLTINLAYMSGGDSEAQAQYYIQQWKAIGLDVQLTTGRLIEFNTFYKMVQEDDPQIDIYAGAWGVGHDAHPGNLWGRNESNYSRFTSEAQDKLFERMNSLTEMSDPAKQVAAYKEWQKYAADEAFALPLLYRTGVTAINKRVKNFDISAGLTHWGYNLHTLELTADAPVAHK